MISFVYIEHLPPINLVELLVLGWPFYNSKSSKPNRSASPFRRRLNYVQELSTSQLNGLILRLSQSLPKSLFDSRDELASGTSIEGSNRHTPAPIAIRALTPAIAPVVAPLAVSGSADSSSLVRYLEDNLQRILRTVLDFRSPAPVSAPVVANAPHYEDSREQPLKAWFPDIC